jgi:dienelactone hydrolase
VEQRLDSWPRDVPVLMLLAGSDGTVGTAGCESLVRAQTTRGYAVYLHVYPGAKHGYDIDPALLDGYDERYDPAAALDTRERIIDFLAQTLRSGAQGLPPVAGSGDAGRVAEKPVHVQNSHRRLR